MSTYVPATYDRTSAPTADELHVLDRMGCGYSRSAYAQLRRAGGARAWFEEQLDPGSIAESRTAAAVDDWFADLQKSPQEIWSDDRHDRKRGFEFAHDLSNYSMLKRIYSRRTVFESMVEFWSNHLHVDASKFPAFCHRPDYDRLIRQHALGRFDEMLTAASLHPAMLLYLDNWKSVKGAPNENQGRELLELHTVGRETQYDERQVYDSAKLLSGYSLVTGIGGNTSQSAWQPRYDRDSHTTGRVRVLDFEAANTSSNGEQLTRDYLRYLARHPATAQRIARKLAVRFVSDTPSQALVDHLADVFLSSGTDITITLRALVDSEEFWASAGQKVRTPIDDVVATCRALRVKAQEPTGRYSFSNVITGQIDSTVVYQWVSPEGPPDTALAWTGPTRMLNSWRMHWALANGYYPTMDVRYRAPAKYLPRDRIRFDRLVDHLARTLLGRPSTAQMLQAACEGTQTDPSERIDQSHKIVRYQFGRLCAVLLDTPWHMTR